MPESAWFVGEWPLRLMVAAAWSNRVQCRGNDETARPSSGCGSFRTQHLPSNCVALHFRRATHTPHTITDSQMAIGLSREALYVACTLFTLPCACTDKAYMRPSPCFSFMRRRWKSPTATWRRHWRLEVLFCARLPGYTSVAPTPSVSGLRSAV